MILLGFLDVLWWLGNSIGTVVLPAVPSKVTEILTYILNMIGNGLQFCGLVLWDTEVVVPIATMMITILAVCFAFDLAVRIFHVIKLEHRHQERD